MPANKQSLLSFVYQLVSNLIMFAYLSVVRRGCLVFAFEIVACLSFSLTQFFLLV